MTGTILVAVGSFILGFAFAFASNWQQKSKKNTHGIKDLEDKKSEKQEDNTSEIKHLKALITEKDKQIQRETTSAKERLTATLQENKQQELRSLIKLAVLDGVLTKNEREFVLNKAVEFGDDTAWVEKQLDIELEKRKGKAETKLIDKNKEKGTLFEEYVAVKFDKKYFTLLSWAGDKYANGTFSERTKQPDLFLIFKLGKIEQKFAVECKFRSSYFKNGVSWAKKDMLTNYRKFEKEQQIPVFVIIGVGGKASNPSEVFVLPLKDIEYEFLSKAFLQGYLKKNIQTNNFFFEHGNMKLR